MVRQVSLCAALSGNRFSPQDLTNGWVSDTEEDPRAAFYTGGFLPVCAGDRIYFGAAVVTQWWHLVAYDGKKHPIERGLLGFGLTVCDHIDSETAVFCYEVRDNMRYVRMVCDTHYVHAFLVTVNQPFSAADYAARMTAEDAAPLTVLERCVPDEWTLLFTLSGEGTAAVGGSFLPFSAGTLIAVPPRVPLRKTADTGFVDVLIGTDSFLPVSALAVTDDQSRTLHTLFCLMLRLYWASAGHSRALIEPLCGLIGQYAQSASSGSRRSHCVDALYNTLLLRFADPELLLAEELRREPYSPTHLRRLYKEQIGCSPMETLMALRIQRAKTLLADENGLPVSVAQVAALSGFPDPYYFSRIFKQYVGCSPREYRRSVTGKS